MRRAFVAGLGIWASATLAIRLGAHHLVRVDATAWTLVLFAASFAAMAVLIPLVCRALDIDRREWIEAATILMLPTLLLDPFSSAFFTVVFPAADPRAAGVFGGWMLVCCGGALSGVWLSRWREKNA